jgi:peroxiredoxin
MADQNRFLNATLIVLVLALVVVSGLLIKQNRELKAMLAAQHAGQSADIPRLEVGDVVEEFTLSSLDGTATGLDYSDSGSETLLFFFSPDCPACKRNFANWQEIERVDRQQNRRVVFISTADEHKTREYVEDKNLQSEVLVGEPDVLERYKIARIPTTVQVGQGGVVNGVWIGILPDSVVDEL